MSEKTLLWHDYETWGMDPRRDRPAQFAAVRTNAALEEVEEPMMLYCRPTDDFLPHPEAAMLIGISPQEAAAKGINEADFFGQINAAFSQLFGYTEVEAVGRSIDELVVPGHLEAEGVGLTRKAQGGKSS